MHPTPTIDCSCPIGRSAYRAVQLPSAPPGRRADRSSVREEVLVTVELAKLMLEIVKLGLTAVVLVALALLLSS
jgi:hypothetical protein